MISGFVILMTAWGRPTAQVVASRIGRLYPAYWVAVLTTGLLLLVVWPEGKQVTAHQVLVNLTMMQSALGVDHVDGVYWTLWTELRFYLLLGLFSLVGITRRRVVGVALVWPWVALLAERAGATVSPRCSSPTTPRCSPRGWRSSCSSGTARGPTGGCCRGWRSGRTPRWPWRSSCRRAPRCSSGPPGTSPRPAARPRRRGVRGGGRGRGPDPGVALGAPGLVALGGLTYPLYLVHEYWGLGVIRVLADHVPAAVALAAALVVVTGLAWAVHRYVEVPCGPYLRRETLALLEGARSVVLDRLMRGPRMVAGDALTRQAPGMPPTGPAGREPSRIAAQKAGARSGSSRTVEPTLPPGR